MAIALVDIVIAYIDEALDIDDLEKLGDFIHASIVDENLAGWQLPDILKQLHADLTDELMNENDRDRQFRLKSALTHFEADFSEFLIEQETGMLPFLHR